MRPPGTGRAPLVDDSTVRRVLCVVDAVMWFAATTATVLARYDFHLSRVQWTTVVWYATTAAALHVSIGWLTKLYQGIAPIGSFVEATRVALLTAACGVIAGGFFLLVVPDFPQGMALLVPPAALVMMGAARFVVRAVHVRGIQEHNRRSDAMPVLMYGAGNAGAQLGRLIFTDPDARYQVVGIIDDDPGKRSLRFEFGHVVGNRGHLVAQAKRLGAEGVIVAIPSAGTEFLRGLADDLDAADLEMLVLPPVSDIVSGRVSLRDVRHFDVTDLLGREPIQLDLDAISQYLRDQVVLITGAGGSIGSEIARQVHRFEPRELICLDRDESALHAVQLSLYGTGLLDSPDMVLCDIRDSEAVRGVFERHRPDVVFHAAALKHLPLLQQYPDEGWKTNVLGTLNVLEAAAAVGVSRLVNISTDKAADPSSVLGRTKRLAEELTAWFAARHGRYLSVRFGNVLGSRGSVLHTFLDQIERGGPVTVVHPDVTRYFMTIPEACQLVIEAGALGRGGQVMVLDMGQPMRIIDMAKRLIRNSGRDIEIVYTGLRTGEKLHEQLFSSNEAREPSTHPLISSVQVEPRDPRLLQDGLAAEFSRTPIPKEV